MTRAREKIKVYLDQQLVEAYEGEERIYRFECVTGDKWGKSGKSAAIVSYGSAVELTVPLAAFKRLEAGCEVLGKNEHEAESPRLNNSAYSAW